MGQRTVYGAIYNGMLGHYHTNNQCVIIRYETQIMLLSIVKYCVFSQFYQSSKKRAIVSPNLHFK